MTTTYDFTVARPTYRPAEPPVRVAIDGDRVVLRTVGLLDHDATATLIETMNAAIAAGCDLVLELAPAEHEEGLDRGAVTSSVPMAPGRHDVVMTAGAGLLRIPTVATQWTVDVSRRRLCTQDHIRELRFMPVHAWTPIRSLSISTRLVAATAAEPALVVSAVHAAS
jgi:hypothetical protein